MRTFRKLALGASVFALMLSACSTGGGSSATSSTQGSSTNPAANVTVRVGSDDFYESKLMAEIYAQALEAKGYKIDRKAIGLGGRPVTAPALESGQFDLKPEYISSGLLFYKGNATGDPAQNEKALQDILSGKGGGITVLDFSPAVDTNAFVVRKDTADQFHLATLDDAAKVQTQLKWGVAKDCKSNPGCAAALKSAYDIDVSNALPLAACSQPMVEALKAKTIDVGELCSTQPDIAQNGWVVLTDTKHTQGADNIAPLVRNDLLSKVDKTAFEKILNDVSAKMTTDTLTKLNAEIAFDKKDIAVVAKEWLQQNGFV